MNAARIPPSERLRAGLEQVLGCPIEALLSVSEPIGYSRAVRRVAIRTSGGAQAELIIKATDDAEEPAFYTSILTPLSLDAPHVFGSFLSEGDVFFAMEYIPHEPVDWKSRRSYERALEWLMKKDSTVKDHLREIGRCPFVTPSFWGPERWVARLREAAAGDAHPLLTGRLLSRIELDVPDVLGILSAGPQTLNHNDFQLHNVLFGGWPQEDSVHVIDWTDPSIGSTSLDVAKLLFTAPPALRTELMRRYRSDMTGGGDEAVFAAGDWSASLCTAAWMVDALETGRPEWFSLPDLHELLAMLEQGFVAWRRA